jgi:outer membrane protein assembly factor BamB
LVALKKAIALLLLAATMACARPRPAAPDLFVPVRNRWITPLDSGLRGPLATDGDHLFVPTRDALVALHRLSGSVAWTRPATEGSLTAAPGVLLVRADDGRVTSLDPDTKDVRWVARTGNAGALPAAIDGTRAIVAGSSLVALDLETGHPLWSVPLPAPASTAPVVAGGCLLIGGGDGPLRCHDVNDGRMLWSFALSKPLQAPPTPDGHGHLILGTTDRQTLSLKLSNGALDWRFKLGAGVSQAPTAWGELALVASNEGALFAFRRRNGHMAWRAPLPSRPLSRPMVVGSQVIVACHENELVAVDVANGRRLLKSEVNVPRLDRSAGRSELRVPPVLLERVVYAGVRNPLAIVALEPGPAPDFPKPPALTDPDSILPPDDVVEPAAPAVDNPGAKNKT